MAGGWKQRQWIPLQHPAAVELTEEKYSRNMRRRQKETIRNALGRGYLKTLDGEMILHQWEEEEVISAALEHVLRISLPRSGVHALRDNTLLSCPLLRICNLPHCFVQDLSPFYGCVNLLKLDLSNNQVERLPEQGDFWYSLSSLRVLYLHGNNISSKSCLQWMNHCPHLHILTLHSTPLSLFKYYRHLTVNGIMSLLALDTHVVSDEEIIENMRLSRSFQAFSPQLKLQLYQPHPQVRYSVELSGMYELLLAVEHILAHYSPVHIIQRYTRGWLTRVALLKYPNHRIRSLVSKYHTTRRRPEKTRIVAPPPNTAITSDRILHVQHQPNMHAQDFTPSGSPASMMAKLLSVSLPAPPPTSPTISSKTSHSRAVTPGDIQSVPLESHTAALLSPSSKLHHSICLNLNQLTGNESSETLPTSTSAAGHRPTKQEKLKKENYSKREKKGRTWISVEGERAKVVIEKNRVEKLKKSKKESGEKLREDETQIMEEVKKLREPSKTPLKPEPITTIHGAPRLSKDALAFRRVFESMTLSTLKAVDRIHQMEKTKENWKFKASHVAMMKTERENRRRKIQNFQQKTRETIETWKIREENELMRLRDEAEKEKMEDILERAHRRSSIQESRHKDAKESAFVKKFTRKSLSIGREVAKKDRKASLEERKQEIKKQVRDTTEATRQRRRGACVDREKRETQLIMDGEQAKRDLSTKMMKAEADRMCEAKSRVEKALVRREAATVEVERAMDALRMDIKIPKSHKLPPLILDHRTKTQLAQAGEETMKAVTAEPIIAPFRLRSFTHEASRTWQRGTIVLTNREKHITFQESPSSFFPDIEGIAHHHQLRPGCILRRGQNTTPLHSELPIETPSRETCECSSIVVHHCVVGTS